MITEINDSYQALTNLDLTQKHYCYPGGGYNTDVIDVVSDYYGTARTTEAGYNFYNRKYRLKNQAGDSGVSTVQGYIDKAVNDSSWLILMFHEIGVPGGTSNVNMTDFNLILSYLNSSNVDVVTIDEALGNLSIYTTSTGSSITAENKRYIKYRAIIHSYNGSNTPTLDNIKITYLTDNITTTNFDGSTTNLFDVANLSNITNLVIEKSSYGKINFSESVNLSGGADINTHVNISNNRIEINSTALPALNKSATLILYNLSFTDPRVLRDGVACPSSICTEVGYTSDGNFTFTVTQFSVYSARETPITEEETSSGGSYAIFKPTQEKLEEGYEKSMRENWKISFKFNNETHTIKMNKIIDNKTIELMISSEPIIFNLSLSEIKKVNLDEDDYYDLKIFLKDIRGGYADLVVKLISEKIPEEDSEEEKVVKSIPKEKNIFLIIFYFLIGIIILGFIFVLYLIIKKKKLVINFSIKLKNIRERRREKRKEKRKR